MNYKYGMVELVIDILIVVIALIVGVGIGVSYNSTGSLVIAAPKPEQYSFKGFPFPYTTYTMFYLKDGTRCLGSWRAIDCDWNQQYLEESK